MPCLTVDEDLTLARSSAAITVVPNRTDEFKGKTIFLLFDPPVELSALAPALLLCEPLPEPILVLTKTVHIINNKTMNQTTNLKAEHTL